MSGKADAGRSDTGVFRQARTANSRRRHAVPCSTRHGCHLPPVNNTQCSNSSGTHVHSRFSAPNYPKVYRAPGVYCNGDTMPATTGAETSKADERVSAADHKKNSTSTDLLRRSFTASAGFACSCADVSIASNDHSFVVPWPTTTRSTPPIDASPARRATAALTKTILTMPSFPDILNRPGKHTHCYPTNEVLKPLLGIENWCLQLCIRNCPPTLCICVEA